MKSRLVKSRRASPAKGRAWRDLAADLIEADQRSIAMYLAGCLVFSLGVKLFIDAGLGMDPLHAMVIGSFKHLELGPTPLGLVTTLVSLIILLLWSATRERLPPLSTLFTMVLTAFLVDLWNFVGLEKVVMATIGSGPSLMLGLLLDAYASALLIMSGIGLRVMDLLAVSLVHKRGWRFTYGKLLFESGFVVIALLTGGPVGIATLAFLAVVCPVISIFMRANRRYLHLPNHGLHRNEGQVWA